MDYSATVDALDDIKEDNIVLNQENKTLKHEFAVAVSTLPLAKRLEETVTHCRDLEAKNKDLKKSLSLLKRGKRSGHNMSVAEIQLRKEIAASKELVTHLQSLLALERERIATLEHHQRLDKTP